MIINRHQISATSRHQRIMNMVSDQFCLSWNNFQASVSKSWSELRKCSDKQIVLNSNLDLVKQNVMGIIRYRWEV